MQNYGRSWAKQILFFAENQNKSDSLDNFTLEVSYVADQKYIRIAARGGLTVEANMRLVLTALKAIREFNCSRILLDERNVTLGMNIVDIYDLPQCNEELGALKQHRVAIIYNKGTNDKLFQLYEDRAVISDFKHYIFYDEDAALGWLLNEE